MKKFCYAPFQDIQIMNNGKVFFCCPFWLSMPIGNIYTDNFNDIWNSEAAQNIRQSIYNGTYEYCNKNHCQHFIEGTLEHKIRSIKNYENIIKKQIILNEGPTKISLNYDFSCNLYCRSCRDQIEVLSIEEQKN